jgi:hypothetical protein
MASWRGGSQRCTATNQFLRGCRGRKGLAKIWMVPSHSRRAGVSRSQRSSTDL